MIFLAKRIFLLFLIFFLAAGQPIPSIAGEKHEKLSLTLLSEPWPAPEGQPVLFTLRLENKQSVPFLVTRITLSISGINPQSQSFDFVKEINADKIERNKDSLQIRQHWVVHPISIMAAELPEEPYLAGSQKIPYVICDSWLLPGGILTQSFFAIPADRNRKLQFSAQVEAVTLKQETPIYAYSKKKPPIHSPSPFFTPGEKAYDHEKLLPVTTKYDRVKTLPAPRHGVFVLLDPSALGKEMSISKTESFSLKPQSPQYNEVLKEADGYAKGAAFLKPDGVWLLSNGKESMIVDQENTIPLGFDPFPWAKDLLLSRADSFNVFREQDKLPQNLEDYLSRFKPSQTKGGGWKYELPEKELAPFLLSLAKNNAALKEGGAIVPNAKP